jgi:integrase
MAKVLTVAAVAKYRPARKRREIADGGSPGLYLIVQPSGHKSWALRYRRPSGKPAKLTLGGVDLSGSEPTSDPRLGTPLSLVAARALAAEQLRSLARGVDVGAVHIGDKRREREAVANAAVNSFAAMARLFVDQHCRKRNRRWRESATTLGFQYFDEPNREPIMRKNGLALRWLDRPLRDITEDELHDLVVECARDGVPGRARRQCGGDSRARAMAAVLSAFFSWARKERHVKIDPTIGLDKPNAPASRDRVLNARIDVRKGDEVRWFWQACASVDEPYGILLKLLLLTGCRRDELARLTEDEISDDLATIRLPASRTKNHRAHEVYLSPPAIKLIASVPRIHGCKYLFSTNGRTPVLSWSRAKRDLDQAMAKIAKAERGEDFTIPSWRVHDLRRTASTGMHSIGVPPHIVEAVIGHVSGFRSGVAGTYNAHQYAEERKAALSRWAAHVEALVNGTPSTVVVPFAAQS